MGLEDGSRKVCLPASARAHAQARIQGRASVHLSCCHACALMLASICDFPQNGQYRGMNMCAIPLLSVSEHVFGGRGILRVCLYVCFFQMLGFFQNGLEHYCHLWGLKCQNRARGEAGEIKLQTVKVIDDVSDRLTGRLK